jgi:RNA polymerase sigma-70 factor (ECF subfamily)
MLFAISDEEAMGRVQTLADPAAFARLVERWEQPIQRLCARMTGDYHLGQDLKQEAFARVFAGRNRYRPPARFSTWIWRIALNLCYDELRRRHRHGECSLPRVAANEEQASTEVSPDNHLVAQEEHRMLRQALQRLPETQRRALVLRFCHGLKLREISEILNVPGSTANSRIALGLAQLTRMLKTKLEPDSFFV